MATQFNIDWKQDQKLATMELGEHGKNDVLYFYFLLHGNEYKCNQIIIFGRGEPRRKVLFEKTIIIPLDLDAAAMKEMKKEIVNTYLEKCLNPQIEENKKEATRMQLLLFEMPSYED